MIPVRASVRRGLGLPNWITLGRGGTGLALAGFLVVSAPPSWAHWTAGAVFTLVALADNVDGYLARRLGQVTLLGKRLDQAVDRLVMLVGILLGIRWSGLPLWFLSLGLAPYLFSAFLAVRRSLNAPVHPLPFRASRRHICGLLYAWVAFSISPPALWAEGWAPSIMTAMDLLTGGLVLGSFLLDGWMSMQVYARESEEGAGS